MKFTKPAKSYDEQVALLKGRGLVIASEERAVRWLKRVSYYRLSAYFIPFRANDGTEDFKPSATFDSIIDLYKFDARLRLLFLQAVERIEIAFRTSITYEVAHTYGPFAHTDQNTYSKWFLSPTKIGEPAPFVKLMQTLANEEKKAKEMFVKAYRSKYTSETHLPIWMATELMSFGTLSMMFEGLKSATKTKIASGYGLAEDPFRSWLHVLATLRNFCSHHNRLWNRQLGVKPAIPHSWKYEVKQPDRTYCLAVILRYLISLVSPECKWQDRVFALFDQHPDVDLVAMGFPPDWRRQPPWSHL